MASARGLLRLSGRTRQSLAGQALPAARCSAFTQQGRRGFVVFAGTEVRFRIPGPNEEIHTIDDDEVEAAVDREKGRAVRLVQWYPGHIARAERQLKEQLRLVDVAIDVRDSRIPLATSHPMVPSWIGPNKLRLVVLNQMDKISDKEQVRWAKYFSAQANTRVLFTNGQNGDGVPKLLKAATSVSGQLNEQRAAKGLQPRPVRVAVVGFPNVGKSALINRLCGRRATASAQRPGVTRHLQWVSLGAEGELMLLDAPGVLPMRLADQTAAVRLAICNDIGEASYTTSLVAAEFVEQVKRLDGGYSRVGLMGARYKLQGAAGMTGEEMVSALAETMMSDKERAGRRILKDYQEGLLGAFGLEQPPKAGDAAPRDYRQEGTGGWERKSTR